MVLNVSASLIAGLILFLLGFFKTFFINLFLNTFYKGVRINGRWKAKQEKETARGYPLTFPTDYTFEIKQFAGKISGVATAEFGHPERESVTYNINGTIKDNFVCLTLLLNETNRISHCHFLLQIIDSAERMEGYMTFYALKANEINAMEIEWKYVGK
ncbi:MAG TPA: hypothetical protein VK796_09590 [Cytophaga sp.]|jgi:hypothetical protein|nr:hypothetical protein [Cytophaga sp.]